jgi:2,3-diphosphopglycerate-independent phosphoglycerate mutase
MECIFLLKVLIVCRTIPGYDGYKVKVRYATEHRCGVCVSGPGLSDGITGTDPLKDNLKLLECKPLEQYDPIERSKAELTSKLINALSMEIHKKLSNHPINQERLKQGKNVANIVLLRGCGIRLNLEAFRNKYRWLFPSEADYAFTIAPTCMISGWMKTLDVWCVSKGLESCTGDFHSNLELKGACATSLLRRSVNEHSDLPWMSDCNNKTYSFGFLHIKAVDDAGHEGRIDLKVHFIERVDKIVGKIISDLREDRETNYVLVVTGDHSTPCVYGDHSSEPVPFLISSLSSLRDSKGHIKKDFSFNEISAVRGSLGRFPGSEVFEIIKQYISVTK